MRLWQFRMLVSLEYVGLEQMGSVQHSMMHVQAGWAAAENIWYLQDLNNVLAEELFPHLTNQFDDWIAHPGPGRVADEVAEFYFLHRYDQLCILEAMPSQKYRHAQYRSWYQCYVTSVNCVLSREDAARVADLYWEYTLPIRKFMVDPSEEGKLVS